MDVFKLRLNVVDHYQSTPTDLDPLLFGRSGSTQRSNAPTVPVIRVFGATETGQKVCAHIHGALPYLYLEYRGALDAVESYIQQLRAHIDSALAISYRRNLYDGKAVFVAHVTLVKGVPFFGYHVGYRHFLKIYLLNPAHMTRFADLLHQGAVMGQVFQPYEAHLQFLAQWMCDYNLYGCANIECSQVRFRDPVPDYLEMDSTLHKWHDRSIAGELMLDPSMYPRQSHCSIEVDICMQDILNRQAVVERDVHASFIERFNPPAPENKLVHSLAGLWKDETRRRKLRLGLSDDSSSPFPAEVLISMTADPRYTGKGGWIHEEEFRLLVEELVAKEAEEGGQSLTFDSFTTSVIDDPSVQTVLKSVEDLFPENLERSMKSTPVSEFALEGNPVNTDLAGYDDAAAQDEHGERLDESDEEKAQELALTQGAALAQSKADVSRSPVSPSPRRSLKRKADSAQLVTARESRGDENADNVHVHTEAKSRHAESGDSVREGWGKTVPISVRSNIPTSKGIGISMHSRKLAQSSPRTNSREIPASKEDSRLELKSTPLSNWTSPRVSDHPSMPTKTTPSQTVVKTSSRLSRLASALLESFHLGDAGPSYCFNKLPPRCNTVQASFGSTAFPETIYQDPFYSDEVDVPDRSRDYAGRDFKLESDTAPFLEAFDPTASSLASCGAKQHVAIDQAKHELAFARRRTACNLASWEIAELPPSWTTVMASNCTSSKKPSRIRERKGDNVSGIKTKPLLVDKNHNEISQVDGPTQRNKHGFKYSQKKKSTSVRHETQYMSTMSLEVHVNSRANLSPDPEHDEIACVFWCLKFDDQEMLSNGKQEGTRVGILVLSEDSSTAKKVAAETGVDVYDEDNELDLINKLVDIVRAFDPDILTGYEVHNGSWGYLIERARVKYEYSLCDEFSRMKSQSHGRFGKDADRWGFNHTSTIRITGRHMINIWRAMRGELNLLQYTMENVVFHVLQKRIPHYSFKDLTEWYTSQAPRDLARCLEYFVTRVQLDLEILEANELVARTSEQARLIGVDFFSVFSRGSQFKVESFMFRIAKPENFLLVSPSRKQVGQQNALECLPLVMEPQSDFYTSPVLVLDFQSLYPSIMIAYNYCYSTCLGRIVGWRGQNKMGFADFKRQPGLLGLVRDSINIAPNGMMYVKPEMRKSLLAKMLGEILETRVMVKSGMKVDKDDKTLQQLLNNRQLALKLLANVTYGYTSASFSGRMPCAEIADSIVQTGRETLERAIALIHSVERWGAEVVYGDTDSLFVHLKGRTKEQAFELGNEIAKKITEMNPRPIKLKFEKVYLPCVLLAKKRYVGFKYESPSQMEPEFDAKGIETVRRDGTPAEQKIEEKALKLLFRTADLSQVKAYFQRQCTKIMLGKISIQDFCFAREVKLGTYADKGPPPPGALIATKRMLEDPRQEPQYGERVPYVVITGAPRARLIDRCVAPEVVAKDDSTELDAEYYISKNLIPPLERILNLVGANVRQWYEEMPKVQRVRDVPAPVEALGTEEDRATKGAVGFKKTLEGYLKSSHCIVCRTKLPRHQDHDDEEHAPSGALLPLCANCQASSPESLYVLNSRLATSSAKVAGLEAVCRNCSGLSWGESVRCDSRDCPVFYSRTRALAKETNSRRLVEYVTSRLESEV